MTVIVTPDLTDIDDAESISNWTSAEDSPALNTAVFREGSNCISIQLSEEAGHFYRTSLGGLDLRNTRIYVWLRAGITIDSKANGGIRVVIGDGTNIIGYFTGGEEEPGFQVGAWTCQMLDTANLPTAFATIAGSEGSLDLSSIAEVGGGFNVPGKAVGNVDNVFIDISRFGNGLVITGGTSSAPGLFTEIIAEDEDQANAFGIIRELENRVYGVQGSLTFGATGSANTFFKDEDAVLIFENHVHASGSAVTPFEMRVYGGTGTTHFELGLPVGTGDNETGRNAIIVRNANITHNPISFIADTPHAEDLLLYGTNFVGVRNLGLPESMVFSPHPGNGQNHRLSGVTFDRCGQVDTGQVVTRQTVFQSTFQTTGTIGYGASSLLWSDIIDVEECSFLANQLQNLLGVGVSGSHGIEHPDPGSFTYVGLTFSTNDFDIEFSAPTGSLTISATQGSDPGTSQITRGGVSVTINNNITLTLTDLQSGSEVRVYNDVAGEAGSEIAGIESSGVTFPIVYNFAGMDIPVIIVILHIDFLIQRLFIDLGATDASLPIFQAADRVYDNP